MPREYCVLRLQYPGLLLEYLRPKAIGHPCQNGACSLKARQVRVQHWGLRYRNTFPAMARIQPRRLRQAGRINASQSWYIARTSAPPSLV